MQLTRTFHAPRSVCEGLDPLRHPLIKGAFHVKKHAVHYVKASSTLRCRPFNLRRNVLMNIAAQTLNAQQQSHSVRFGYTTSLCVWMRGRSRRRGYYGSQQVSATNNQSQERKQHHNPKMRIFLNYSFFFRSPRQKGQYCSCPSLRNHLKRDKILLTLLETNQ